MKPEACSLHTLPLHTALLLARACMPDQPPEGLNYLNLAGPIGLEYDQYDYDIITSEVPSCMHHALITTIISEAPGAFLLPPTPVALLQTVCMGSYSSSRTAPGGNSGNAPTTTCASCAASSGAAYAVPVPVDGPLADADTSVSSAQPSSSSPLSPPASSSTATV